MSLNENDPALAGATDEELAALAELNEQMNGGSADDPEFNPKDVVKGEGEQEQEEEQEEEEQEEEQQDDDQANADADAQAAAKADADAAAAAEAAKPQPQPQRDPILVAQAPDDAEAKLADIATKKGELAEKFDDGDLTSKEFTAQMDALNKEERAIERAQDKAEIARDLENQRITNERMAEINTFLKEVDIPNDPKNLRFSVLNQAVIVVANGDTEGKLSVREVMEQAYELCVAEGALVAKKATAAKDVKADTKTDPKPPKKPINAPPSLANLPASDITDTEDNRFAYLNRITDPDRREAAFAKLSVADQEAYLATGG